MRMLLSAAVLICLGGAAAASVPAEPRSFAGPIHFCGRTFAIDAAADERVSYQAGPDFDLFSLQSPRGGFGLYEGFFPDTFENSRSTVQVGSRTMERLRDAESGWSYLIAVPGTDPQTYLHLYGQVWQGSDADFPLIERVRTGAGGEIGCTAPTASPRQ
ncbi:MAG TPA: hypothetical protein VF693_08465 [Allosphingosinicella sp.]|jgi:hypothetical protein